MQIYNTTKKELVEITVVDPQYGIDWAEDLIGNNCNDLDIIEMPDGAEYLAGDQKQLTGCPNTAKITNWQISLSMILYNL